MFPPVDHADKHTVMTKSSEMASRKANQQARPMQFALVRESLSVPGVLNAQAGNSPVSCELFRSLMAEDALPMLCRVHLSIPRRRTLASQY